MRRLRFRVVEKTGFSTLYPECMDSNDTVKVEESTCRIVEEAAGEDTVSGLTQRHTYKTITSTLLVRQPTEPHC